jgi:hypothetical protein
MRLSIKQRLRPKLLPWLHLWQYLYDESRGRWRGFSFRDTWAGIAERRGAVKRAVSILQDVYGIRFVLYPFDRPNLTRLVRRNHDRGEFRAIPQVVRNGDVAFDIVRMSASTVCC